MEIENVLKDILEQLLNKLQVPYQTIEIEKEENELFRINIESDDPSLLIGFHGENIHALQHLLKVLTWKQVDKDFTILVDVDNYRKRQEDNVINLAERKVDMARKTNKTQVLPPMSSYFRRVIHLHLTKDEFSDVTTESIGDGDHRQVTITMEKSS